MAEGGGLLNRYTVKSRIGGSNPPLSAIPHKTINSKGFYACSRVSQDSGGSVQKGSVLGKDFSWLVTLRSPYKSEGKELVRLNRDMACLASMKNPFANRRLALTCVLAAVSFEMRAAPVLWNTLGSSGGDRFLGAIYGSDSRARSGRNRQPCRRAVCGATNEQRG